MKTMCIALVCFLLMFPTRAGAQALGSDESTSVPTGWVHASIASPLRTGKPLRDLWRRDTQVAWQEANGAHEPDHKPSWPARHPVLTGAMIGAGVGAALAATGDTEDIGWPGKPAVIAFTAGFGAGVGALIGLAFR